MAVEVTAASAEDTLLLIEVAGARSPTTGQRSSGYAEARIPEYWVID